LADPASATWDTPAGTALPTAALQYPLRHPAVASVMVGLRSPAQVAQAAGNLSQPIGEEVWRQLG
jgi:D-threo-aldose 1-dehydrogenase